MLTVESPQSGVVTEPRRLWHKSLWIAIVGALVSLIVPMVLALTFEPFLAILGVPFVLAACTARWPRVFAVVVGLVCALQLVGAFPTLADTLQHPESIRDLLPLLLFGLSAVIGAIAAIPAFRGTTKDQPPRVILAGCVAVFGVGSVVSGIAAARLPDASLQPGDTAITARDTKFSEESITLDATASALFVKNDDATRHTFTVDELGIDEELPAKRATRFTIEGEPGTYRYHCRPHPDMTGELTLR
jgi:plastocyanin